MRILSTKHAPDYRDRTRPAHASACKTNNGIRDKDMILIAKLLATIEETIEKIKRTAKIKMTSMTKMSAPEPK